MKFDQPTFDYLEPQTRQVEGFEPALTRQIVWQVENTEDRTQSLKGYTVNHSHRSNNTAIWIISLLVLIISALMLAACGGPTNLPLAKEGTLLRKIQDRGKLIVGVRYELPTFGYLNPQTKQVEGFEPALAREIAVYIFGDPNKLEFKETLIQNRIPYLKDSTVDLVLSNFIITEDRLKDVDFSVVYFITGGALLVPRTSSIKSVADLDGKKVATAKSPLYSDQLKKMTKAEFVQVETLTDAISPLLNKQVDAISSNEVALYALQLTTSDLAVVGRYSTEYFGAGVAKGQPELLDVVNTVMKSVKSSGKWQTLWKTEVGGKLGISTIPEPPADEWHK